MLNKFTQYSARFNQFYTGFFLIVDADDFFLAFETNCTEFRHTLFPRERDLYVHESNGNVRTYGNQAYTPVICERGIKLIHQRPTQAQIKWKK